MFSRNNYEALKGEKQKQSLESLRRYAVSQLDREEKELKQSLSRLREEREILAQIDSLQGKLKAQWRGIRCEKNLEVKTKVKNLQ